MKYPLVALKGITVMPENIRHILMGKNQPVNEIKSICEQYDKVAVFKQKDENTQADSQNIHNYGVIAKIKIMLEDRNGNIGVDIIAEKRVKLVGLCEESNMVFAEVEECEYSVVSEDEEAVLLSNLKEAMNELIALSPPKLKKELRGIMSKNTSLNTKIDNLCAFLEELDTQALLSTDDTKTRVLVACVAIKKNAGMIAVANEINAKVTEKMKDNQREYYLREQQRIISEELGDEDDDAGEITKKIEALNAPDEVKNKLKKELKRSIRMQPSSPDFSIIRNYIDFALSLPWGKYSQDEFDIAKVKEVLDKDHYGLEKVKERILEYLAVKKLAKGENKAPVLCFVGAPGVGKTSVAQSVARALNKEYVHMSLGGVHDEAEIRGHRKTYVGAMPGRLLSCLSKANTSNPLFLLDEIDKMTSDMKGDPSSAMLEVLDPAQNHIFRDNYLELPYDLSQVFFITTANTLSTVQKPLLDRMEVIEMSGYTEEEKLQIAQKYLIPKQIKENGLDTDRVKFSEKAVQTIINKYTRESGVRNLERKIAAVCRKLATEVVFNNSEADYNFEVDEAKAVQCLGVHQYTEGDDIVNGEIGAVNGLAWTSAGGVTMPIEAKLIKGKGELVLTGSLGDVMKESAKIALSLIKVNAEKLGIDTSVFEKNDVHIHVPEGATPKDGPSAGIALTTALTSAFANKKVNKDLAMTGEITLRGKVLQIGGLKEKTLAALRSGIKTVLIPKGNEKELCELPESVKTNLKIVAVENIDEVFEYAFN